MRRYFLLFYIGLIVSCSEIPRFERLSSESTGIDFINTIVENDSFHIMNMEYIYNGGGVGVGDLNNDGLQDLVFTGNKVSSRVYVNSGDLKFEDVTSNFEGLSNDQWFSGVTMVDIIKNE